MCDVSETNNECNDSKVKWRKQPAGGGTQGDGPAVIEDISKECFTDNKRYVNNEMLAESYVFAKMWTCCHRLCIVPLAQTMTLHIDQQFPENKLFKIKLQR